MTDIMHEYKEQKFVIADSKLIDMEDSNLIVLSDITYWNDNYDALIDWCEPLGAEVRGMTVTCSDAVVTAFVLRWA